MKAILTAIDVFSDHQHARIAEVCSRIIYAGLKTELVDVIKKMGLDIHTELHADVKETSFIKRYYPTSLKSLYKDLTPILIDTRKGRSEGKTTLTHRGGEASENRQLIDPAKVTSCFPNGRLQVITDAGHLIPMEKPKEILNIKKEIVDCVG